LNIQNLINITERICNYNFKDLIEEDGEVIVDSRRIHFYPVGCVGVQGSYDSGIAHITLISDYNDCQVFDFTEKSVRRWFRTELKKVIAHEKIHIEQEARGDFAPSSSSNDYVYYSNDSEIEAYGRADVPIEVLEDYGGRSQTVKLYSDLFGEDSLQMNELLRFYKSETGWDYPYNHVRSYI